VNDRHLNVFYAYSHGSYEDIGEEKMLEDNVTRALMVTLLSSSGLTSEFLKYFMGFESKGNYDYELQPRNRREEQSDGEGERKRLRGRKYLLAICRDKKVPNRSDAIPEALEDAIIKVCEDDKRRRDLQNLLIRAGNEDVTDGSVASNKLLAVLKGQLPSAPEFPMDRPHLKYLLELTRGSRPDGVIKGTDFIALLESKLYGSAVHGQIRRHISENLGSALGPAYQIYPGTGNTKRNEVPVVICSWRDVYSFFKSYEDSFDESQDPKVLFLVGDFIKYLEELGMGETKFTRGDFLEWQRDYYQNKEKARSLLRKIEALGDDLANYLSDHWVNTQNVSPEYLGVNLVHDKYKRNRPVDVPHWSLALHQMGGGERFLRFFIQCESKKLSQTLVRQRSSLEPKLVEELSKAVSKEPIAFKVKEKLFLTRGGKGPLAGIWSECFCYPLHLSNNETDLEGAARQALDVMASLNSPEHRRRKLEALPDDVKKFPGQTVVGVLQFGYDMNWLQLEEVGAQITEKLKVIGNQMRPFYETLLRFV